MVHLVATETKENNGQGRGLDFPRGSRGRTVKVI
jgi:hypothetical protein